MLKGKILSPSVLYLYTPFSSDMMTQSSYVTNFYIIKKNSSGVLLLNGLSNYLSFQAFFFVLFEK